MAKASFSIFFLLFALLAGCSQGSDDASPPDSAAPGVAVVGPAQARSLPGYTVAVGQPVALAGPLATEPSIAVATDRLVAVAATAGVSNPTVYTSGGPVWVSTDGAASFELRLDPTANFRSGGCSCDTEVVSHNGGLVASTMYWAVNPLFNANVVFSADDGQTWTLQSAAAAQYQPIDRQWLASGPAGDLLMTYTRFEGVADGPTPLPPNLVGQPNTIYLQKSADDGKTWREATPVLHYGEGEGYDAMKPRVIEPDTVLVPVVRLTADSPKGTLQVAVSHDGGETFRRDTLSSPFDFYAAFTGSLDAMPSGRVVAAWTEPAPSTGTNQVHVRESADKGDTWGPERVLRLPGSAQQPWVALHPNGWTAIAFYGTNSTGPVPDMDADAGWLARVALIPPGQDQPAIVADLTDEPTFFGVLCNLRPGCPDETPPSPMREFLSAQWSPNGTLHAAFIDGREQSPDSDALGPLPTRQGRVTVTSLRVA